MFRSISKLASLKEGLSFTGDDAAGDGRVLLHLSSDKCNAGIEFGVVLSSMVNVLLLSEQ